MRWSDSTIWRGRHRRWLGPMWLLWLVAGGWLGGVRGGWVEMGNTNTGPHTRLEAMHMHDRWHSHPTPTRPDRSPVLGTLLGVC